ncbi:MAG: hypothetical protein Q9165_004306 [Trypethelium subeluteriae]
MSASLHVRDVSNDVNGVKQTFSGWDSCMQKAYCKWPVIVGCCGSSRSKRRDDYGPSSAPLYQQPQPYTTPYSSAAPPTYSTKPQFARFDVSKKGGVGGPHDDALPAMPSWDDATSHKVEVEEDEPEGEGTEMQHLDPSNNQPGTHPTPMRSQQNTPTNLYGGAASAAIPGYAANNNNNNNNNNNYSRSNLSQPSSQANPYATNQQHASPYHTSPSPTYSRPAASTAPYSPPVSPPQPGYRGSPVAAGSGYVSPPPVQHQQQGGYASSAYSESNYGYAPSGSTRYEPSNAGTAYQGAGGAAPYQPKQYQAYGGGASSPTAAAQGMERKPVQGSWKDI